MYMKNIIFDLGGVLTIGKPYSILDNLNLDSDTYNDLKRFFEYYRELDLGNISLEEAFNNCNFAEDIKTKYKDYVINYYKHRIFNKELFDLIKRLKMNNYKVYILSDNNREVANYYQSYELFKDIDGGVVSCDYGTVKRDGTLFDIILDKYNLKPEECYFIDDNEINVKVGEEHGIKGYIYSINDSIDKIYSDMRSNGISI